jgi:hypothetical protein
LAISMTQRFCNQVTRFRTFAIFLATWAIVSKGGAQTVEVPHVAPQVPHGPARLIAKLESNEISESSGLAVSRRQPGVFWTHNDSGDTARIFSFDMAGRHLGICRIMGAHAVDWEDMCSFERNGKKWLLLADVGDNGRRRNTYELYLSEEPAANATEADARRISFRYDRGSHDCESVAVDPTLGVALLVTKVAGLSCSVFQLAIPEELTKETLIAEPIGNIAIPLAVAMDISPDGLRAVILTYGDALEFTRTKDESWRDGFARAPQRIAMPARRQGEAICYGHNGKSLYLTCEARQSPLWEVPWLGESSNSFSRPAD